MILKIGKFKLDLVLLLIGVCPVFFFGRSPDMQAEQLMFMHFIVVLMLACVLCNRWLGGFLLLVLAHKFLFQSVAWLDYALPLSVGLLLYHLVFNYYDGKKYPYVILALLVFNLGVAGLQALHIPWLSQQMLQPDGMLALPSFLGMVFAMTAPIIATIHPLCLIVTLLGIFISKSAFAAAATAISLAFYAWQLYPKAGKRILICLLPLLLIAVPFVKRGVSSEEMTRRFHIWPMVASKAFHNMWAGVGAGNAQNTMFLEFKDEKPGGVHTYFQVDVKPENEQVLKDKLLEIAHNAHVDTTRLEAFHFKHPAGVFNIMRDVIDELRGRQLGGYIWSHSHNEYLQVFLQFGVLGLILMFGYLWDICARYRKSFMKSKETIALMGSMIAIMILGCAHFELYMAKTVCLIIVFMALLDRQLEK